MLISGERSNQNNIRLEEVLGTSPSAAVGASFHTCWICALVLREIQPHLLSLHPLHEWWTWVVSTVWSCRLLRVMSCGSRLFGSIYRILPSCMLRVYNCIILIVHDVICAATSTATNKFSLPTCWRSSSSVWRQWRAPGSSTQRSVTLSFTFRAFRIKNKAYVAKRLQIGQVKDVGLTTFSIMSHNINTSRKGQSHVTLMHAN